MSKIEVKSIYKVFGPHPAKWLQAAQGGMSKEELLAKSGHAGPARHQPVHRRRQHLRHHGPVRLG